MDDVTAAEFGHYMKLQRSKRYLPIAKLQADCLYLIHARNSHIGLWCAEDQSFLILREKFGRTELSKEYHWDVEDVESRGTAKPFVALTTPLDRVKAAEVLTHWLEKIPYSRSIELTAPYTGK